MSFEKTLAEYNSVINSCREVFINKTKDYGTSWRAMRPRSLTDQMFIKAKRIRTIEESGSQKIDDSIASEFMGLVNYGYMALIQMKADSKLPIDLSIEETTNLYEAEVNEVRDLMAAKNSDYGEAWRDMRISSFTDLILTKLHRIKQIEDNQGATIISEGADNYSIFALI